MRHRATSDSGKAVSLFPFLAVLLCTMGALLVLLVVLSQRAGERALAAASVVEQVEVESALFEQPSTEEEDASAELVSRLEKISERKEKLAELRREAAEKLRAEQDKLTHLEEHTRRLEHELARLHVAAEQLKAAENKQSVDQQQAEKELQRLQSMIAEKEKSVEELQEEVKSKRSYAIVPFQGTDGTAAPRIYIECSSKGVIIQPEGIVFDKDDFFAEEWPGNPLAKAVRATQQYLNENARLAGEAIIDPMPLFIVRPSGIVPLGFARQALDAAEISYGFDFVGGDQKIIFPTSINPLLAKAQHQARANARQELSSHIAAAPRKYRQKLEAIAVSAEGIGNGPAGARQALLARLMQTGSGSGSGANPDDTGGASDARYGAYDEVGGPNGGGQFGDAASGEAANSVAMAGESGGGNQASEGGNSAVGAVQGAEQYGAGAVGAQQSSGGEISAVQSEVSRLGAVSNVSLSAAPLAAGPKEANRMYSATTKAKPEEQVGRLSEKPTPRSVPIQRPIQVVVRKDQFALLPSRHVSANDINSSGTVISMNQSTKQIGAELRLGLRDHIDKWGIAGQGLYWKPVLSLKVGPDGVETARRLAEMLSNSGLQVRLPEELGRSEGGNTNATR